MPMNMVIQEKRRELGLLSSYSGFSFSGSGQEAIKYRVESKKVEKIAKL